MTRTRSVRRKPKRHRKRPRMNVRECIYCGEFADTQDHVPSVAVRKFLPLVCNVAFALVPACRHCNLTILRSDCSLTVNERKRVVLEYLLKAAADAPRENEDLKRRLAFALERCPRPRG